MVYVYESTKQKIRHRRLPCYQATNDRKSVQQYERTAVRAYSRRSYEHNVIMLHAVAQLLVLQFRHTPYPNSPDSWSMLLQ